MANNYQQYSAELSNLTPKETLWIKKELKKMPDPQDDTDQTEYFQYKLEKGKYDNSLWFFSNDYGNPDAVANFVQKFLKKFRPNECWGMAWADTCSKLRLDAFGGGAIFVTANKIQFINTESWLEGKKNDFENDNLWQKRKVNNP